MSSIYQNEQGFPKNILGNYVYLNWANYERAGTRNIWTKEQPSRPVISNFNEKIFFMHKANILNTVRSFKISNIRQLEDAYNTSLQKRNDQMRQIFQTDTESFKGIMDLLISTLGKRYALKINELLPLVTWDGDRERPVIIGKINDLNLDQIPAPPSIGFGVSSHGKRGQCRPRIKWCDDMKKYIESINQGNPNEDSKQLDQIQEDLQNIQTSYRALKNIINKNAIAYELTNEQALGIDKQLNNIRAGYIDVQQLNTVLAAAWAEFTGNILEQDLNLITWREMYQAVSVGKQTTQSSSEKENTVSIKINDKAAVSYFEKKYREAQKLSGNLNSKQIKQIAKQAKINANFKTLGSSVSNKRDIEVTLRGEKYGISMKNTNLLAPIDIDAELSEHQIPHVALQTSSLALYLMAIEANDEALGTHYLNILATHSDIDSKYKDMRKQANKSLTLYILYSTLTGEGQLRSQSKVNIFAIYDKAKRNGEYRVKFYDIASLILNIAQMEDFEKMNFLYPKIPDIKLNNDYEEALDDKVNGVAVRRAKVLLEARTANIAAYLTNDFLQNIYKNRN